jgi:dolichyl-phosphate-mannose-protein mannosyltransferase
MKSISLKKLLLCLSIFASIFLVVHNINQYPTDQGYIFGLHTKYADIITSQWRLPTLTETAVAYNPPLFYVISGLFTRIINQITQQGFRSSIQFWPYLGSILSAIGLWLWFKIIKKLSPQDKWLAGITLLWTFSIPMLQKMLPMYTIESFLLFTFVLTLWYFIAILQPKPTIKKTLILSLLVSINVLSRLTALVLLPTILFGLLGLGLIKRISWKKTAKLSLIFIITVSIASGWFYYLRRNQKIIYGTTGGKKENIAYIKHGLSFYYDVPFKYMMTYPFRRDIRYNPPLNKFIPIYYSTFWGDYWNYYIQSRFNISYQDREDNRYIITPQRIKSLSLQNQVNLVPSLIIAMGFIYQFILIVKNTFKKKFNDQWLIQAMFLTLSLSTWFGFLYFITFHPSWKGDGIKASYMLYNLPIFIYWAVLFLFNKVRSQKILFIPITIWLVLATGINLWWAWY